MRTDSQVKTGRGKQKERTRRLIVEAATELMRQGLVPSVERAAGAAEVSPATGYRYFPSQGALLQAAVAAGFESWSEDLFHDLDVMERIDALIDVGFPHLASHEVLDRAVLRLALDQWLRRQAGQELREEEVRREGRKPLVEQIIEPLGDKIGRASLQRLRNALGMILGIESFVALRDIYELGPNEVAETWRWACKALVERAVFEESGRTSSKHGTR